MKEHGLNRKKKRLISELQKYDTLMVAFSGGVDSTLLLAVAAETIKGGLVAVTAESPVHPEREKPGAAALAKRLGVRHVVLRSREMEHSDFKANPTDRCYICKKYLFEDLLKLAASMRIEHVAHGANTDDLADFRPGFAAAKEMGIHAPLVDAGLSKQDIRLLSKEMNLETWDKPPMACLATRIPYGTPLTREKLAMVERAEAIVLGLGIGTLRVRVHDTLARIEVAPQDMEKIMKPEIRETIVRKLRSLGFFHVSLDLEGYVQGSMNRPSGRGPDR